MDVTFEVAEQTYALPERQATILSENLRILARSEFVTTPQPAKLAGVEGDWRASAFEVADSIEDVLTAGLAGRLRLEGAAADATYCVLRLMVGLDADGGGAGLRDALGAPVVPRAVAREGRRAPALDPSRHLTRPELLELLIILFVLAVLTVIAGVTWTDSWYVLAPVIAALLGVRVATTRASGRFAWSFASVLWWGLLLIPAAVLVVLAALLLATIL